MLDLKFLRENPEKVKEGVAAKGFDPALVEKVLRLDGEKRGLQQEIDDLRKRRKEIAETRQQPSEEGKRLKTLLKEKEERLGEREGKLHDQLDALPNLPLPAVPRGKNESENKVHRFWGTPRKFDFPVKDHLELGKILGILDFEAGAKVSGSQFYFLCHEGALLEVALVQYALKLLQPEGFVPVITPDLAHARYYLGTGYLPRGKEAQTYAIEGEDLGLIATAEVTLAGKHADEVILEERLPLKYVGYSHCFRREAGAYGKYSRGLYRVHQFTKIEMFIYCLPEDSEKYHQEILSKEEKIYQKLKIPYRVVEMCTGDLGAMAARKFDLEAWMPGRNAYGEITSTSNCTDYQARNLNVRLRRHDGKVEYVHMLNGTAVATSRTLIAILENYQQADGSVMVPEVLRAYIGKDVIEPRSGSG